MIIIFRPSLIPLLKSDFKRKILCLLINFQLNAKFRSHKKTRIFELTFFKYKLSLEYISMKTLAQAYIRMFKIRRQTKMKNRIVPWHILIISVPN